MLDKLHGVHPELDKSRPFISEAIVLVFLVALVVLSKAYVWDMNAENLHIPIVYLGDAIGCIAFIKAVHGSSVIIGDTAMGYPDYFHTLDYPNGGLYQNTTWWIMAKFVSPFTAILNIYVLYTAAINAASAYASMRMLKHSKAWAVLGGLGFALLPWYLSRIHHLHYMDLWVIPVLMAACILMARGDARWWRSKWKYLVLLAIIVSGLHVVYIAIYAVFYFMIVAAIRLFSTRQWRQILAPLCCACCVTGVFVLQIIPSIIFWFQQGRLSGVSRHPKDTEIFGLKLIQLILPSPHHRVEWLRDQTLVYNEYAPYVNENSSVNLGLLGVLGFLFLSVVLFLQLRRSWGLQRYRIESSLFYAGLLWGTVGGGAMIFSHFVSGNLRSNNRIAPFIAFIAIHAAVIFLSRYVSGRLKKWSILVAVVMSLIVFIELTPSPLKHVRELSSEPWERDARFYASVQEQLPQGSVILQLPLAGAPESRAVAKMPAYSQFALQIHTDGLISSHGASTRRNGYLFLKQLGSLPPQQLVQESVWAGFDYIEFNALGYDQPDFLRNEFDQLLVPVVSDDHGRVMYDLQPVYEQLKLKYGADLDQYRQKFRAKEILNYQHVQQVKARLAEAGMKNDNASAVFWLTRPSIDGRGPDQWIEKAKDLNRAYELQWGESLKNDRRLWETLEGLLHEPETSLTEIVKSMVPPGIEVEPEGQVVLAYAQHEPIRRNREGLELPASYKVRMKFEHESNTVEFITYLLYLQCEHYGLRIVNVENDQFLVFEDAKANQRLLYEFELTPGENYELVLTREESGYQLTINDRDYGQRRSLFREQPGKCWIQVGLQKSRRNIYLGNITAFRLEDMSTSK